MHLEWRLWSFTEGFRAEIFFSTILGLASSAFGVARLAMLGWLLGLLFKGESVSELIWLIVLIAVVMIMRGLFEHWRTMTAHHTAAKVQKKLRRNLFDHISELGPAYVGSQRSGAITLSLVEGVEQLETYFGQYIPQLLVSFLTPILIFCFVFWIDLPVAATLVTFALLALFLPALWHSRDVESSKNRQVAYATFASEFLDSIQGLATLKSFGQSSRRADGLEVKARDLFEKTMWVLGTNVLSRGITDCAITIGAAAALILGAYRVADEKMELAGLLIILMMGVEIFRPMRDLRSVLHQGMVGMSAAQGIYKILDAEPIIEEVKTTASLGELRPTVEFESVHFQYPNTSRAVHKSLDFKINVGDRVGFVGPSGCGKSSLVKLLLRFFDPDAGTVRVGGIDIRELSLDQIRSQIAVVSQDTFLFHGTIRENILMGCPDATEQELQEAAKTANIHNFIKQLPDKYNTIIGEKGIKLSGGQRQRVAIARAVLRNSPILVLDEALSAVDAENEAVIQDALDKLMKERTTIILAHRLSSIIDCDRIMVLNDGKITESGTHTELLENGGIYAELMRDQANASGKSESFSDKQEPYMSTGAESLADTSGGAKQAVTEGIIKAEGLNWFQLVSSLMRIIMPWKGRLALTFLLGVLRVLAYIGVGVSSALIVLSLKNNGQFDDYLIWLIVLAPTAGLAHWLESWVAHDMAFRLLAEMRIKAFRKLDALAPAYLVRRRTGDLMNLATHDIELIEYFFAHTVAPAFVAIFIPTLVILILGLESYWIALALIPFLLAVGLSPFLKRKKVDRLGSKAREAAGELGAFAIDSVQGLNEIVSFQQENKRSDGFDKLADEHIALRLPFFSELTGQQSMLEILTGLGGLAVVITGALLVNTGEIEAGILPLLAILAMSAFLPVSEIAQIGRQLADTLGSTRRYYGLENEPVTIKDGANNKIGENNFDIAIQDIDFSYPGQNRHALKRVSFSIPSGNTIALVGTSGAGKTTLAQILMRFWDPDNGKVKLNGVDLREYNLETLRAQISLVAQDTYLFNDTLRANILIARPEASEADLQQAIENAALGEMIAALPDGLETRVGERGTSLSGGQRQRVAIARAFLKDAPVLILDEATSHLDAVNETAIRKQLEALKTNRTTIVIAHRLSTVRDADKIIVMEEGKVVEMGRHEELLNAGGLYAQLISRQLASIHNSS